MVKTRNVNELIKLVKNKDYINDVNNMNVDELVKLLKKLSDVYYNTGSSLVSDKIYDDIKDVLEKKDKANLYLKEVGAPIKGTKEKIKLPFEMGSLIKIKPDTNDVKKWTDKYNGPYVISDKLDGASAQLYKDEKGKLFLFSRGDGHEGQNISHLLTYLFKKSILDNLPNNISIRGELIISKANFKKIDSFMKNARNAVSGLVNSKTVDIRVSGVTKFVAYAILHPRYKQSDQMILLHELGFETVYHAKIHENKLNDEVLKKTLTNRKKNSPYEIDGIVCIDDSVVYGHEGGYPEHARAFKMMTDDQVEIATVVKVIWTPSKYGILYPKVQIKPVNLSGTTITYATAFHADFVVNNKIGPGAKIKITKGGEVIPDILEVTKAAKDGPQMPDIDYEWSKTNVDIIMTDLKGEGSETVTVKLISSFFKVLGVKYLSEGIVTKLVENNYDTIEKILTADKNKLVKIEGIGEKMIQKIYDEIDRAFQEIDIVTFMAASHKFGKGLGEKKLREIVNEYPNILLEGWSKAKIKEQVMKVEGFSDTLSSLFADNFTKFKKFYNDISKIVDLSRFEEEVDSDSDSDFSEGSNNVKIFEGKSIVFTGFRDKDLEQFVIKNGGKVSGSVSGNTFILVCKDGADTTTSKFVKAQEKGTTIMTKSEFIKKYNA